MQYINLIDQLSEEDKAKIKNYIFHYGIVEDKFIGLERYLQQWSHSNQKLYKLLGNQFIYKIKFSYQKDEKILNKQISDFFFHDKGFSEQYYRFCNDIINFPNVTAVLAKQFTTIFSIKNFLENKIDVNIKYKFPRAKRTLQLSSGMKISKALMRIADYFKDYFNFNKIDDFCLRYSQILNEKTLSGNLCISIHPLDFLTMSDNGFNWSSCMSWTHLNCDYKIGSVEMMNSNNVLCCYLEAPNHPWTFVKGEKPNNFNTWNNKKWRNLFFITKDILMNGKAYPYTCKDINIKLLNLIAELANKNLKWQYTYGPELYKDMKHIHNLYRMNNNRYWIKTKDTKKHNIIWDTKGMYNDMLNHGDDIDYWCYRNKVKHNKIISISGKSTCLCCGKPTLSLSEYNEGEYNERYENTCDLICPDCEEQFHCEKCGVSDPTLKYYKVNNKFCCEKCIERYVKICPDCGKPFIVFYEYPTTELDRHVFAWAINKGELTSKEEVLENPVKYAEYRPRNPLDKFLISSKGKNCLYYLEPLWLCHKCFDKHQDKLTLLKEDPQLVRRSWNRFTDGETYIIKDSTFDTQKYLYENLQSATIENIKNKNIF